MAGEHPAWTRNRIGRDRVHWVAYDDRPDSGTAHVVDQGYAATLAEADAAARSALAAAGMYQARRISKGSGLSGGRDRPRPRTPGQPAGSDRPRRREYVFTRHQGDQDAAPLVAAHLILKKTARRVYVTRRSLGPDQIGTVDEDWGPDEPTYALDRARLDRDGSVYSRSHRHSDFFATREGAMGDSANLKNSAFGDLGLRPPCTVDDIKAAYRRRALEVHPDRGGDPRDFQAVETAYRRLLREAQAPEP